LQAYFLIIRNTQTIREGAATPRKYDISPVICHFPAVIYGFAPVISHFPAVVYDFIPVGSHFIVVVYDFILVVYHLEIIQDLNPECKEGSLLKSSEQPVMHNRSVTKTVLYKNL